MTELSTVAAGDLDVVPDNDWPHNDLTPAELAAIETDPHVSFCREPRGLCVPCMEAFRAVRRILLAARPLIDEEILEAAALAQADEHRRLAVQGLLLPPGAQRRVQVMITWVYADGTTVEWGPATLEDARELVKEPPDAAMSGEIRTRDHWAGPWSVVEPVEVPDAPR